MEISKFFKLVVCAGVAAGLIVKAGTARGGESEKGHPWSVSLSAGRIDMEGDFPTKDGYISSLRVGYDYSDWWTFEGGVFVAPSLKAQTIKGRQKPDGSFEYSKPLEVNGGVSETTACGVTLDALFHLAPWKTLYPYLSLGVMGIRFTDDLADEDNAPLYGGLSGGAGVIYNFNHEWSVRADCRGVFADINDKGTVNSTLDVGVRYAFGAGVPSSRRVAGGHQDSGVAGGPSGAEALKPGVIPPGPDVDTDKDEVSDSDEVRVYKTDPLNPDTDFDGLNDGLEVFKYKTDPNERDTDGGGVADGHEVVEDRTNPKEKADDLEMYELHIEFAEGRAELGAQYHEHLDVIGKILADSPVATVRIEGHTDQLKGVSERQAVRLTQSRAESVLRYLAGGKWKIKPSRMEAVGYGFGRPKGKPDLENGNSASRRVEVYIRRPGGK